MFRRASPPQMSQILIFIARMLGTTQVTKRPHAHILAQVWMVPAKIALTCPFWLTVSAFPHKRRVEIWMSIVSKFLAAFLVLVCRSFHSRAPCRAQCAAELCMLCSFSPSFVLISSAISHSQLRCWRTLVTSAARPSVPEPTLLCRMASHACRQRGVHVALPKSIVLNIVMVW